MSDLFIASSFSRRRQSATEHRSNECFAALIRIAEKRSIAWESQQGSQTNRTASFGFWCLLSNAATISQMAMTPTTKTVSNKSNNRLTLLLNLYFSLKTATVFVAVLSAFLPLQQRCIGGTHSAAGLPEKPVSRWAGNAAKSLEGGGGFFFFFLAKWALCRA